ncbi:hypothetical protein PAHAL_6G254900 [Panicum hallii]|uniref:Uncharacterized protein n=1 Tax=Panicum hallii TaxID=206008 RepID=A0A2S3I3P3_9POAL|nr:hypothetical protein PAHAL_6G254900 [Panicum hallii]
MRESQAFFSIQTRFRFPLLGDCCCFCCCCFSFFLQTICSFVDYRFKNSIDHWRSK